MRKFLALTLVTLAGVLSACTSTLSDTATVSYDARATHPMEVQRMADQQCAKVNKRAVRRASRSEGPEPYSRNDDFDCVDERRDDNRNERRDYR